MDRQRSLARAYKRYHQAIYRYCLTIVGNPDDAQEALQNTMVKALRALQDERRQVQLKPWLYRIAHNESIELLRKRREASEVDDEQAASGAGLAETAAQRDRLRHLLADLRELPERQRAALVMRELGGLSFEEIGETFDTSKAVARQTVYEARLGLRELEAGREMSCEEVMHRLSNADGRVSRRRDIRAHLRNCPDCRAFRDGIEQRREDLAALSPLPVAAAAATLHAVFGGSQASASVGAATVGAGVGKAVATSAVLKTAATVAAVAVIGAGVADRSGLVDLGLPGDGKSDPKPAQGTDRRAAARDAQHRSTDAGGRSAHGGANGVEAKSGSDAAETPANDPEGGTATTTPSSHAAPASSGELPAASQHGQETAASHGGGRDAAGSHSQGSSKAAEAPKGPPSQPPSSPAQPEQPAKTQPPPKDIGPDNAPAPPSQPSEGPPNRGGPS